MHSYLTTYFSVRGIDVLEDIFGDGKSADIGSFIPYVFRHRL